VDEQLPDAPSGTHRLGLGQVEWANRAERRVRKLEVLFLAEDDTVLASMPMSFSSYPHFPTIEDCYDLIEGINQRRFRV
jgi:hypothetical protein